MPFSLRNTTQAFQRNMDNLRNMPFARGNTDDLLIASPDLKPHKHHVRAVLKQLSEKE